MNLPVRPEDTPVPRRRSLHVNTARFSEPDDEIVVEEDTVRWYHHPWRVVALVCTSIVVAMLVWHFIHVSPAFKVCAIMLGLFWLFAFGIHPLHAAARTVGSFFGDDDD